MEPSVSAREIYKQMRTYFKREDAMLAKTPNNEDNYDEDGAGICQYRTWDGNKCAVGSLIPDENYRPYFEGTNASKLVELLGLLAEGKATPLDFQSNGADWGSFQDYAEVMPDEEDEGQWRDPGVEAANAAVLYRILDSDPAKVEFLQKAQVLHDTESADAADFVRRLEELARKEGVIS